MHQWENFIFEYKLNLLLRISKHFCFLLCPRNGIFVFAARLCGEWEILVVELRLQTVTSEKVQNSNLADRMQVYLSNYVSHT